MVKNIVAFSAALFLLATFGFLSYFINTVLVIAFFGLVAIFLILLYIFLRGKLKLKENDVFLICLLGVLFFHADSPFLPYPVSGVNIFFYITLVFILCLPLKLKLKVFEYLQMLVVVSSIASLVVFILYAMGFQVVNWETGGTAKRYYIIFPGMSVLSTNFWDFGNIVFFRSNGLLKEPGHFAILCSLLLGADKFKFNKFRNKAILVGGLLTFSAAFYIILTMGLVIFTVGKNNYKYFIAGSLFVLLLFYAIFTFIPEEVQYRLFHYDENRYSSDESMLDARAKGDIDSIILESDIPTFIFGHGRGFFRIEEEGTSDFRMSIVSYGIFGFLLLLIVYFFLIFKHKNYRLLIIFLFLFFLIASHRIQFVYYPMSIFIFYIAYYLHNQSCVPTKQFKAHSTKFSRFQSPSKERGFYLCRVGNTLISKTEHESF